MIRKGGLLLGWKNTLLIALLSAALVVVLVLLFLSVRSLINRKKAEKILLTGKRNGTLLYKAIRTAYPGVTVFRNLMIPVARKDGSRVFLRSELTVVGKSGVTLIFSYPYGGKIDNPYHGDWVTYGAKEPVSFRNPMERGSAVASAIGKNLNRRNLTNVPLTSLSVFFGDRLFFNHESDRVLRQDELLDRLDALSRNSFLSLPERKAVCRVLSGFQEKGTKKQ